MTTSKGDLSGTHSNGEVFHPVDPAGGIYKELPPGCIRLLILEPAMDACDALIATLETLDLGPALPPIPKKPSEWEDTPSVREEYSEQIRNYNILIESRRLPYNALSYSWAMDDGDVSQDHVITLEGRVKCITRNLAEGLCRLRSRSEARRLWVDVVCIDQANTAERSIQVAMMLAIFSLSQRVDIWLGNGAEGADYTFWYLAHCVEMKNLHALDTIPDPWSFESPTSDCFEAFARASAEACCTSGSCTSCHYNASLHATEPYDARRYEGVLRALENWASPEQREESRMLLKLDMVLALMRRRYWSRRWVVQENAAHTITAGNKMYHWGKYAMASDVMETALKVLALKISQWEESAQLVVKGKQLRNTINDPAVRETWELDLFLLLQKLSDGRKLANTINELMTVGTRETDMCLLLQDFSDMQCADPRDRLYSLIAIAQTTGLHADYKLSFSEVCVALAKDLAANGEFRVLVAASHPRPEPQVSLPSWVPDLRAPFLCQPFAGYWRRGAYMQGAVVEGNTMLLKVCRLGSVIDFEFNHERHIVTIKPEGVDFFSGAMPEGLEPLPGSDPAVVLPPVAEVKLQLGSQVSAQLWPAACDGDALFLIDEKNIPGWYYSVVWLRPVNLESFTYELIAASNIARVLTKGRHLDNMRRRQDSMTSVRLV